MIIVSIPTVSLSKAPKVTAKIAGDNFSNYLRLFNVENFERLPNDKKYNIWFNYIEWLNTSLNP